VLLLRVGNEDVVSVLSSRHRAYDETRRKANEIGLDFVIFGGMTLKSGRQKGGEPWGYAPRDPGKAWVFLG
jgi:hypothetical protein